LILLLTACATTKPQIHTEEKIQPAASIVQAVQKFYQRMRGADMAGFEEFISTDPSLVVMGSAGERFSKRETLRGVFRLKNEGLEAGPHPLGWESGDFAWFVDEPDWVFPDGSRVHMRFTVVAHREAGAWRFVHWHLSVPVPDEEAGPLQARRLQKTK
jgi:hypothetical protein